MCVGGLVLFSSLSSFLWLLLLPLLGCFYGKEPVLYCSLLLCLVTVMTYTASRISILGEPLVQFASVVVVLLLPINLVPYPLVWLYDKILWLSEPGLQFLEVILAVKCILNLGQALVDRIDDQPNLVKGIILAVSGLAYAGAAHLASSLWSSGFLAYKWLLCIVLLCMVSLHVFTLKIETGVISDAALTTLFTLMLFNTMQEDLSSTEKGLSFPLEWQHLAGHTSCLNLLVRIVTSGLSSVGHAWTFLGKLCNLWFICSAALRIASILYFLTLIETILSQEDDGADDDDDENWQGLACYSCWQSQPVIRVVCITVYAHFLVHHLHLSLHASDSLLHMWTLICPYGRLVQMVLLFVMITHKLYKREQMEDIDGWM